MQLIYQLGEEVDFSDAFNSHCFLRDGWGEIEDWGVWTTGRYAELYFQVCSAGGLNLAGFCSSIFNG